MNGYGNEVVSQSNRISKKSIGGSNQAKRPSPMTDGSPQDDVTAGSLQAILGTTSGRIDQEIPGSLETDFQKGTAGVCNSVTAHGLVPPLVSHVIRHQGQMPGIHLDSVRPKNRLDLHDDGNPPRLHPVRVQ